MSANAEAINGVSLVVEGEDGVFIDVVRCDNGQVGEPRDVKVLGDVLKCFPGDLRKISQVSRVYAYSDGGVAKVVQCHGHGCKV